MLLLFVWTTLSSSCFSCQLPLVLSVDTEIVALGKEENSVAVPQRWHFCFFRHEKYSEPLGIQSKPQGYIAFFCLGTRGRPNPVETRLPTCDILKLIWIRLYISKAEVSLCEHRLLFRRYSSNEGDLGRPPSTSSLLLTFFDWPIKKLLQFLTASFTKCLWPYFKLMVQR